MSDILLNYINNNVCLSKKIGNIELEFRNGVYFCELIEKLFNIKPINIISEPKSLSEIKHNFDIMKNNLQTIGIYISDSIIKEIIEGKNGAAAKIIYKIKIEVSRRKIDFNNILEKLNKNYLNEKTKYSNIKQKFIEKKQNDEFLASFSVTSRHNNEKSLLKEKNKSNKIKKIYNFRELNNLEKLKSSLIDNNDIRRKNDILKFPKLKSEEKSINFNQTFQSFLTKNSEDNNLLKINEEKKSKDKENINNSIYYLNTNYTNKSMKKTHSLFEFDKGINLDAINNRTKSNINYSEKINNGSLIKYSSFQKNSLKIGFNIDDITPKIKKHAYIVKNDLFVSPFHLKNNLKLILKKNEESKMKLKRIINPLNNYSFLNSQKHLIEKSIIKTPSDTEEKLFKTRFNKTSSIYKMLEYTRKLDDKNINIDRLLKNKRQFSSEIFQPNIPTEEIKQYDINKYLDNLIITKQYKKSNNNSKNEKENYDNMRNIIDLILDLTELFHKKQVKLNQELINIPEYRELNDYFIEGKSFSNLIKINRNQNNAGHAEKISKTNLINIKGEFKNKTTMKKEKIIKDEIINMEYLDYLNFRANWNIDKFINKELFGKQLNIVTLLENNIFKFINVSNDYIQTLKQSIMQKKDVNNKEFELTEEELDNISIPEENNKNNLFGEIIFLNYDNIASDYSNNKKNLKIDEAFEKNRTTEEKNKIDESKNENYDKNFGYIPIKICFLGHSFSGRRTQAKLLSEKYKNLKSYSINDITQFYIDEYKRIHLQTEDKTKNKSSKKNDNENKLIEEEKYKFAFDLIENSKNFDKNKIEELTQEQLSDEIKIDLLINQIKIDFPKKNESELVEKINERIQKRQNLEEELKKLMEVQDDNIANINSSTNKKELKNNTKTMSIQNINDELEKIKIESLEGFILYDFPNTYNQMMKLENTLTGYIQPIDLDINIRDFQMNNLTKSIDKPYINITNNNQDISTFFNNNNNIFFNQKSFFNSYFIIDLSEEETLKRMNNRFKDPITNIIYHTEYNPPNPNDKKLNERLIELKEPSEKQIKELILQFYQEYPKILYLLNIFNNYYRIEEIEKNKVFEKIESNILIELKKYEEGENKDIIGNLVDQINEEKNEIIRYLKRLKEIKRVLPKEISEEIINNWAEFQDKYQLNIKNFIKNYFELKKNILKQMKDYQEEFIDFLNKSSKKYKLVDIFYKKYNLILEKFPYIQNNKLVKEELENNIIELSGCLWELIQERKLDSLLQLKEIKNQNFIEQNLEIFGNYIINLIISETKQYYNKINIIKKFYYEFEKPKLSDNFPYEYQFKDESLLEDINNYQIFIPFNNNDIEKKESLNKNERIISPKIEKVYFNCFKLFFYYDNEMLTLKNKLKEEYNNNLEQSKSSRAKKKFKSVKKRTLRDIQNIEINKIINEEEELKNALINEKSKYKIRLLFLKNFSEKKLEEIYNIGQKTFKDLDQYIIDSVNSQNKALNELMMKIKKIVNEGNFKLKIKDVELDIFDIYEKSNINFEQFNIDCLSLIPEKEKKIDYKELYNIYLEIKNYEIQDNYVYLSTFFDVVFKKYLFDKKSNAFMKYMQKIPCYFLFSFINKFVFKKTRKYSIIKLKEIFTILGLLNKMPPKTEQINNKLKDINDKLKYCTYLTKNDFIENKLWFEPEDKDNNLKELKDMNKTPRGSSMHTVNFINKLKEGMNKDKKFKMRGSRIMQKYKFGMLNNDKDIIKETEEEQLKEYLFNINKNNDDLINFIEFINIINIKKDNEKNKEKIHLENLNIIKSNLDKEEIFNINSLVESINKTQINEPNKNLEISDNNNDIKIKIVNEKSLVSKNKINNTNNNILIDSPEEKIKANLPENTYFDYFIKI